MKRSVLLVISLSLTLVAMIYGGAWLLAGNEQAVASAQHDMRNLSIKLSLIRITIIGSLTLFGWPLITKTIQRWCAVDIAHKKLKVTAWYLSAEAAILLSLWSTA